jgi:hypothetical protein
LTNEQVGSGFPPSSTENFVDLDFRRIALDADDQDIVAKMEPLTLRGLKDAEAWLEKARLEKHGTVKIGIGPAKRANQTNQNLKIPNSCRWQVQKRGEAG